MNRNDRNVLRARGENWGDGSHQFDQDLFDVDEDTCTGSDWGESIDAWDIVAHDLSGAECGKHYENFRCLCKALFSHGAIMGAPHYTCEPCH